MESSALAKFTLKREGERGVKVGREFKFKFPRHNREKELKKDKVQKSEDWEFNERRR